MEHSPS